MTEIEPAPPFAEPAAPAPAEPVSEWFSALPRLWSLRAVARLRPEPSPRVSWTLAAASVALWVGIDHWQIQPHPEFQLEGVVLLAWYGLAVLALAALLRSLTRPVPAFTAVSALVLGLVPPLLLLASLAAATLADRWIWADRAMLALYAASYTGRGLRALVGRSQVGAAALACVFVGGFVWASDALDAIPDVWTSADAGSTAPDASAAPVSGAAETPHVDGEALLFEQPARIDGLRPGTGTQPAAFFLGFAGVGAEPEFAGEIGLAGRVIGARFGAGERRLELVNDERNFDAAPLASVSGLRYALRGIAARMRLDRDVLFLAISSHGAEDGSIAVEDADLPLDELTPEDLAASLRESGIKWRVVIVSACYSGAFVEPLRGPETIVITAAAADRTSFGCSNDRDLTYFGEAFYRDALPKAKTLRDAFAKAKAAIAERERSEGMTPSEPQAFFGPALEKILEDSKHFE